MKNIKQIVGVMIFCGILVAGLAWMIEQKSTPPALLLNEEGTLEELGGPLTPEEREVINVETTNTMNPTAIFTTTKGVIEIELYADVMPITAGNFAKLAEEGFYDGIKFHRVIDGFMIQGGDPNSKGEDTSIYGTGGPGYAITDEHVEGELLTNTRGSISMANSGPNSGRSQFFINTADNVMLDFDKEPLSSKHPVFGRVTSGMDVIDAISGTETGARDLPVTPVIIESLTIKTNEVSE